MAIAITQKQKEKQHWEYHAPKTAQYPYSDAMASGTPQFAQAVCTAQDLYKYVENYPREPAVLSLIYEPECIKYFFPQLTITEDELELAKKIIKSHVYQQVLSKCKDTSILDRLDSNINPRVTVEFTVLPQWTSELMDSVMPRADGVGDEL